MAPMAMHAVVCASLVGVQTATKLAQTVGVVAINIYFQLLLIWWMIIYIHAPIQMGSADMQSIFILNSNGSSR